VDLTLALAFGAGLLSFVSPCVLPLVPAYLGQLTAVAVVGRESGTPSRWLAVGHALAYVVGFGAVFTLLGLAATFAAGPIVDYLPAIRFAGGLLLILLGLNVAGLLRIPFLERSWRPFEAGAAGSVATATGTVALGTGGGGSFGERLGGRLVTSRGGWLASLGLGAVFAVGWTPCVGPILGAILGLATTAGSTLQGGLLLLAYTAGLGVPFVAIAALYDRAPALLAPLIRHGREVSLVGGLLIVVVGLAIAFGWLALVPQLIPFNTQI
jgi:cytochrome c-type biogenesis protein